MTDIIDELTWRGLLAISTDLDDLRKALDAGPVTFYGGFDPTAPGLHIGNLVLLLTMRRFQQAGHRPIGLVGGATGLIGDPSGKSAERILNPRETVAGWVERIRGEVGQYLDFDPGPTGALMVSNLDWTADLSALDFLRDIGLPMSEVYGMSENSSHQYTLPSDSPETIVATCGRACAAYEITLWDPENPDIAVAPGAVGAGAGGDGDGDTDATGAPGA